MTMQQSLLEGGLDPHVRRELDFYETFRWQAAALLRRIRTRQEWTYLEPCAGNCAIANLFREEGFPMRTSDIVERDAKLDMLADATRYEGWGQMRALIGPIDVVVSNLPFEAAFHIVRLAVEYCSVGCAFLLRTTWDEPVEDRATKEDKDEWLAVHPPAAKIQMPRARYRGTSSSDSATHAWFVWEKSPLVLLADQAPPFGGPHMTVTRKERDFLVATYGKGAHAA